MRRKKRFLKQFNMLCTNDKFVVFLFLFKKWSKKGEKKQIFYSKDFELFQFLIASNYLYYFPYLEFDKTLVNKKIIKQFNKLSFEFKLNFIIEQLIFFKKYDYTFLDLAYNLIKYQKAQFMQ